MNTNSNYPKSTNTQSTNIKPAHPVPGSQAAHLQAGLDPRDLPYLTVNLHRSRPETFAELILRTTGQPYTGSIGHISIE